VDTGRDDELKNNILNEKFNYPEGKVKEITEDKVVISLPDGKETEIPRRTAIQSINDVSVYTEPKVKVGQKVKQGDVITGGVGVTHDTYKAGLNTLVLFHAYHGLINEDALVVSESYANRMSSYSIIDVPINVKNSAAIKWIAPVGTKVKSKDPIVTLYKTTRLDEVNKALNEKLGGLFGEEGKDLSVYTIEDHLRVPNNIDEAIVSDVMIQEMKKPIIPKTIKAPDYSFTKTSKKVIDEYEKTKDRKIIYNKYPEYIAADTLDPINMDPTEYKIVYTVRIRLIKKQNVVVGSKITSRYGKYIAIVKQNKLLERKI
jgi:DNA-directed RNA polymerase beta subunit